MPREGFCSIFESVLLVQHLAVQSIAVVRPGSRVVSLNNNMNFKDAIKLTVERLIGSLSSVVMDILKVPPRWS